MQFTLSFRPRWAIRYVVATAATWAIICATAYAQENEQDHDALRKLKSLYERAVNTNDLELLRPHLDDSYAAVTFTNREFTDWDEFKTQWQKSREKFLAGGSYKVTLLPERSQIIGDVALAFGDSENVLITGSGDEYRFSSRWTSVCRKVDGQWKIRRIHSSIDPFNNPMVRAGARKAVIQYTIVAAIGGIIFGWLLHWLISRRSLRVAAPESSSQE